MNNKTIIPADSQNKLDQMKEDTLNHPQHQNFEYCESCEQQGTAPNQNHKLN